MIVVAPDPAGIARAVEALRQGEVVCYPTETVYGLGVDPFNVSALELLYRVKQRDTANPVLLIVGAIEQLSEIAMPLSARARRYARAFWPGPLSMVLNAAPGLPELLIGPSQSVCARWTASSVAANLCRHFGRAIVSTSANRSGEPPASRLADVALEGIAVAVDGGALPDSRPSTVFDPESGKVLREGAVASDLLYRLSP
jgi:L-threonylcarbamoyladenylate synthase